MPFLPRIPRFLRNIVHRRKVEQDLADEVSSYVDLATQRKMTEGLSETEARRAALVVLSRFLSTILFGVTVHDTVTFIAVPACLIVIALLAGYLPARRATKVDPVTSLRYE